MDCLNTFVDFGSFVSPCPETQVKACQFSFLVLSQKWKMSTYKSFCWLCSRTVENLSENSESSDSFFNWRCRGDNIPTRRIMVFDDGWSSVHMLKTSISSENCIIIKMLTWLADTWEQVLTHFLSMASKQRRRISSKNSLLFMFSESSLHSIKKHERPANKKNLWPMQKWKWTSFKTKKPKSSKLHVFCMLLGGNLCGQHWRFCSGDLETHEENSNFT